MPHKQERQEGMTYITRVGLVLSVLGAFAYRERDRKAFF